MKKMTLMMMNKVCRDDDVDAWIERACQPKRNNAVSLGFTAALNISTILLYRKRSSWLYEAVLVLSHLPHHATPILSFYPQNWKE